MTYREFTRNNIMFLQRICDNARSIQVWAEKGPELDKWKKVEINCRESYLQLESMLLQMSADRADTELTEKI